MTQTVHKLHHWGDGNDTAQVLVLGTTPGKEEVFDRKPFAGPVGEIVRGLIDGIVGEAWYTNLYKCGSECRYCPAMLAQEIENIRPTVIVTLGHIPTSFMVNRAKVTMQHMRGLPIRVRRFGMDLTVLPTFDPGYVMRKGGFNSAVGHQWIDDIEELSQLV